MISAIAVTLAIWCTHTPGVGPRLARLDRPASARPTLTPAAVLSVLVPVLGLVVAGPIGAVAALVLVPVARSVLHRTETMAQRRERERAARDTPLALDLVAAVMDGGLAPHDACRVVADHLPSPVSDHVRVLGEQLGPPALGGSRVATVPPGSWGPAMRALLRSAGSGASVARAIDAAADDARREHAAARRAAAQRIAVRTAGPLGACFLPAFLCIGVVPSVLALVLPHLG